MCFMPHKVYILHKKLLKNGSVITLSKKLKDGHFLFYICPINKANISRFSVLFAKPLICFITRKLANTR